MVSASRIVPVFACLLLLVACANNVVYGDDAVLEGNVYLDCTLECLSRGSCRPTGGIGREEVFLGAEPAFPGVSAVSFEGLADGTAVEVIGTQMVLGVEQASGNELRIRFYSVRHPVSGTTGWVPGFCTANRSP